MKGLECADEYITVVMLKDGKPVNLKALESYGVHFECGAPVVRVNGAAVSGSSYNVTINDVIIKVLHEKMPSWASGILTMFGTIEINDELYVYVSYFNAPDEEPKKFLFRYCDLIEKYANLIMFRYARELAVNIEEFSGYKPLFEESSLNKETKDIKKMQGL